jgi:immunoglobulin-binding protein 1
MNRELEVLAMAPPTPSAGPEALEQDYRERNGIRGQQDYSDRLDRPIQEILGGGHSGPLLSRDGKPLRPFTLLDGRQKVQQGVFRPDHSLPTMSIDEYLEEERRRGGIIEGGGEASGRSPTPDEDNYEKADAEVEKARAWDEYVEANPK